ncbi:hypothetical protein BHM03_00002028, partial [Ensete ventricosum]
VFLAFEHIEQDEELTYEEEFIGGQEVGELRASISTMRHASSSGFGGKTGAPSAGHLLCHCKNFR